MVLPHGTSWAWGQGEGAIQVDHVIKTPSFKELEIE
jgi:hypothetical protein